MELLKKNVRMLHETGKITDQVTVEEDCIVPDTLPDAGKIVWKKAWIKMEDIQIEEQRAQLTGQLMVQVLYLDETKERGMHRLETSIPFQETQMLGEGASKEQTQIQRKVEDITVSLINSRKIGIHALLSFELCTEQSREIPVVVELHGVTDVSVRRKKLELLELKHQKKDIFRIKEEISLPSSKPTIREIIWEHMQLRGMEIRPSEGRLEIKGELFVFLLYEADEEQGTMQWLESAVPFQGNLEDSAIQSDMISSVQVQLGHGSLELMNDYDGEMRQLSVEAALDLDIRLYGEESVDILQDAYAPTRELLPVREDQNYESLIMKKNFRIKAAGKMRLLTSQPRMLQICSNTGEGNLDDVRIKEQELTIEGAVLIHTLYVSSDDKIPYAVLEDAVPFQQKMEIPDLDENCHIRVQLHLEQLSVSMLDSETTEAKATLAVELFAVKEQQESCITEIEMKEIDLKKLQDLPGIIGYVVQPKDSLWSIAKEYYTTPEKICTLNHIEEKDVKPGLGLVIVKTVS